MASAPERGAGLFRDLGHDRGYCGVDFGLGPDGSVLLFEANATMVVNPPGADQRWDYRRPAVAKILEAVNAMILGRAAAAQKQRVA